MTLSNEKSSSRRRILTIAAVVLGLVAPIGTLVFGWSYASVRETRYKQEHARDPGEREATARHFAWEMTGLTGLVALLAAAGIATIRAFRRAEELARERALFVSAVSHELRTPLATLRLHAEMLAEGLVSEERKPRVFDELVTETARLTRLVENVLEASRLGEDRRLLRRAPEDLVAVTRRAIATMERTAASRGFEVTEPDGDPIVAPVDATAVEIVVLNLIDNALKYAAGLDPAVILVRVRREAEWAILTVRDHGPGIAPPERERVFDRFYRTETPGMEHRPGTGLGLALVRELARAHGGEARVVDTEGAGATVEVRFPLA